MEYIGRHKITVFTHQPFTEMKQFLKFMAIVSMAAAMLVSCTSEEDETKIYSISIISFNFSGEDSSAIDVGLSEMNRFATAFKDEMGCEDVSLILLKDSEKSVTNRFNKVASAFEPATGLGISGSFKYGLYIHTEDGNLLLAATPLYQYSK